MTTPEKPERPDAPTVQVARNSAETDGSATPAAAGASENGTSAAPAAAEAPAPATPEVNSAPPPWQRVPSDVQYAKEQHQDDVPAEAGQAERFEEWGYAGAQPNDDYSTVVTGTAAASAMPGAARAGAGSAGINAGINANARLGPEPVGRTTVNLATPPPPNAPRPSGSSTPPSALRRPGRGPRRASLQVKRVDPWSVLKLAFVLSVALFFVWLVAVGVLYGVLDGMGVWDKLNSDYNSFAQSSTTTGATALITVQRVFGVAAIIGAINIVLFTALATVGAFVYNVSADLAGGLEVTLAERE